MVGEDFALINTLLNVGIIAGQLPMNRINQIYPLGWLLSASMISWGVVSRAVCADNALHPDVFPTGSRDNGLHAGQEADLWTPFDTGYLSSVVSTLSAANEYNVVHQVGTALDYSGVSGAVGGVGGDSSAVSLW